LCRCAGYSRIISAVSLAANRKIQTGD
jgi:aerobic-type carbon monoxide dehydrogenase small subunit (CoxS/CutS family)